MPPEDKEWIELRVTETVDAPNQVEFIRHQPARAQVAAYLDAAHDLQDVRTPGHNGFDWGDDYDAGEYRAPVDWLSNAFTSHVHVVDCQPGRQCVFLVVPVFCGRSQTIGRDAVKAQNPGSYAGTKSPIAIVQLRAVSTKDGLRWVSWCTNPGCTAFRAPRGVLRHLFFQGSLADHSQHTIESICPDGKSVCECGEAAIQVLCPSVNDFLQYVEECQEDGAFRPLLCLPV
jgi:hypothetical protein